MANDRQAVKENLEFMPLSLEGHYWFYSQSSDRDIQQDLLLSLKAYWLAKIRAHPYSAIEHLAFSFVQLCTPWSCCKGTITREFLIMLTELKAEVADLFKQLPSLHPQIALMPCLHQPPELKILIAKSIVRNLLKRGDSLVQFLATLPHDVKDIVLSELPPPPEECPPTVPLTFTPSDENEPDNW